MNFQTLMKSQSAETGAVLRGGAPDQQDNTSMLASVAAYWPDSGTVSCPLGTTGERGTQRTGTTSLPDQFNDAVLWLFHRSEASKAAVPEAV